MTRKIPTPTVKNLTKRAWNLKTTNDFNGLTPFIQIFREQGRFNMYLGNSYNYKVSNLGKFTDEKECLIKLKDIRKNKIFGFNGLVN